MKFLRFIVCLALLVLPFQVSRAQVSPALSAVLQHTLDSLCAKHKVKGITAAAYIPGQGMWKGVTGLSHAGTPVDTGMLMCIGSVTKTFVAAQILRLAENGQLSLDDSIGKYTKAHPLVDSTITIRQLLGHKSGLGDVTNMTWQNAMFADLYRKWHHQEVLDSFLTAPVFPKGAAWGYSNANYVLLGLILERITQDSLHHVLRGNFLDPLGMKNTYLRIFEPFSQPIAHNWSAPGFNPANAQDVSAYPHEALFSSVAPDGGLFSDAADIAWWGYNLYSGKILSPSSVAQMTTWHNVNGSYYNGYGLGSMRFPHRGRTYFGHAGNYFGYAASMLYHPADSICVSLLINQDCISPNITVELFHDLLQSLKTTDIRNTTHSLSAAVYPNPASQSAFVRISIPYSTEVQLTLHDVTGKLCHESSVKLPGGTSTLELPADRLQPGFYLCRVSAPGAHIVHKLVISRQ
jgi:D-alanyl-D-alanine carboxypeptidase